MKKILFAVIITAVFAACGNKPNTAVVPVIDTAAILKNAAIVEQARLKAEADSLAIVKKATLAERERIANSEVKHRRTTYSSSNTGASETPTSSGSGTETNKKQGWSKAATGAAIGAGAGGVAGALLDHGKGRGTIIGAAVGAGAGYIIGRKADVKSGRVVKKTPVTTTNP